MSILRVREDWSARQHSIDDEYTKRAKRRFNVVVDDEFTDGIDVRRAVGVPRIFDPHPNDDQQLCRLIEPKQRAGNWRVWDVDVDYSSKGADPDQEEENPLDRPAEIDWDTKETRVAQQQDFDGKACVNSAGCPFDSPLEEIEYWDVLTITRNQVSYDRDLARRFRGQVNQRAWYGGPAGSSKCVHISSRKQNEEGISFWRTTFRFEIRELDEDENGDPISPWYRNILDAGFEEFDPVAGVFRKIVTEGPGGGQPLSQPALLDGSGGKLVQGADPVYLRFAFFFFRDFTELNLP